MTRDEAIEKVKEIWGGSPKTSAHQVDTLAALGILKLDEPKSVEDRACEALKRLLVLDGVSSRQVVLALDIAGLQIVEK